MYPIALGGGTSGHVSALVRTENNRAPHEQLVLVLVFIFVELYDLYLQSKS